VGVARHVDVERAVAVERAGEDFVFFLLADRRGLTRERGFVHVRAAREHAAVHGDALARTDADEVAGLERVDRHGLLSVRSNP
jgi:hypothetical protein